jgi:hypothetical protein
MTQHTRAGRSRPALFGDALRDALDPKLRDR